MIPSCDDLLTHITQLSSKQRPTPKSYSDLIESLKESSGEMLHQIQEAKEKQDNELLDFETRLDSFSESLQNYDSQLESQKGRIDSMISQHQDTFVKAQENRGEQFEADNISRSNDFTNLLDESNEKQLASLEEYEAKMENLYSGQNEKGVSELKTLQNQNERAKEIVGIIGNIGVTGNYQKIANEEKETANKYRKAAVFFLV